MAQLNAILSSNAGAMGNTLEVNGAFKQLKTGIDGVVGSLQAFNRELGLIHISVNKDNIGGLSAVGATISNADPIIPSDKKVSEDLRPIPAGFVNEMTDAAKEAAKKLKDQLESGITQAAKKGFDDTLKTLTSLSEIADGKIDLAMSKVISSLTTGINGVLQSVLVTGLQNYFKKAFDNIDFKSWTGKVSAGLGILGSIVSGASSPTSPEMQAIGGVLSGAGAGMLMGTQLGTVAGLPGMLVGGVIGGVAGLIGGWLGGSRAKKEKEAQEAQLAEQKRTNALLERQNALAYSSSIVGQMTAAGVVTGVDRDAYGQLVARVSGQDLQFVLERVGGKR